MSTTAEDMTALIREIRTAFNQLRSLAESLHADLGINPSMRAMLEALAIKTPQTVPEIAKSRGVSRQHVQKIMNALVEDSLVRVTDNPDHRRSVLYQLTQLGKNRYTQIRAREAAPLALLADKLSEQEVAQGTRCLAHLNHAIDSHLKKRKST
jgi:DNA-binding MarR family transcriptional regulator